MQGCVRGGVTGQIVFVFDSPCSSIELVSQCTQDSTMVASYVVVHNSNGRYSCTQLRWRTVSESVTCGVRCRVAVSDELVPVRRKQYSIYICMRP